MEYAIKLAEIGCECYFERVVDAVVDDHSNDPDFVERRKSICRLRYRRDPRPGAVVPDRRKVPSRRDIDLKLLERDGDFPGDNGPEGRLSPSHAALKAPLAVRRTSCKMRALQPTGNRSWPTAKSKVFSISESRPGA